MSMMRTLMVSPMEPGRALGRSWELGDAGAIAALPQTSSAPAMPQLPGLETRGNGTALHGKGFLNANTRQ